jgi:hypothetical protein
VPLNHYLQAQMGTKPCDNGYRPCKRGCGVRPPLRPVVSIAAAALLFVAIIVIVVI